MKKMLTRLMSMLLCFVFFCGMLPALPVSAAITGNDGAYYFETFADLKQLASQTYSDVTHIYYEGTGDLVISEDLTIPENWELYLFNENGMTATIPAGVTVTFPENSYLNAYHLIVDGTLNTQSSCWIDGDLTVNGSISTLGNIYLFGDTLTGLENIHLNDEYSEIYRYFYFESLSEAVSFLNETVAKETHHIYYEVNLENEERVRLTESLTIPSNCDLDLEGASFVVAEGCTLTVEGCLYVYENCNLIVNGTLCNNNIVRFTAEDRHRLRFNQGSAYSGEGTLDVDVSLGETITDVIQGVENFTFEKNYEDLDYTNYYVHMENASIVGVPTGDVSRIAGKTRYATSFAIADAMKEVLDIDQFSSIIVASGTNFADALAGSYLATVKQAPILITNGQNSDDICNYVTENLAEDGIVYILGGNAAVPQLVEDALLSAGVEVKRLSGKTRFDTNIAILEEADLQDMYEILVCTGYNFADSLSASATGLPILLVNNGTGQLTDSQREMLDSLENVSFTIIGGTGAVSEELEAQLWEYGYVDRISGKDRYLTSIAVADYYAGIPSQAVLAYGRNFPDGLCGGPLAYFLNAPLLLTQAGSETAAAEYCADYDLGGYILGGDGVLSDETVRTVFGLEADAVIPKK